MCNDVTYCFTGKNFIVVGASSGMGRQVAIELAEADAKVLVMARRREKLEELRTKYPENIIVAAIDVVEKEIVEDEIKKFVSIYGKLNGCVYTAGIASITPLRAFNDDKAKDIMNINCWSAINIMKIVNKKKYAAEGCSSVLFSSVSGYIGEKGLTAYSISKAALQIAVKTIAKEIYGNKNRINTISPGMVNTEMVENENTEYGICDEILKRHLLGIGNPQDVSGLVLFLLSSRASWITGTDIVVDGGYLLGGV